MTGPARFLTELKRRKVYRVAAVYAVVAWAVVEVAELALPRLGLPDAAVTFILVAALLGFPIAVVLAWAYESTPRGVVRTRALADETTPPITAVLPAAAVATAIVGLAGWWVLTGRSPIQADVDTGRVSGPTSVAVLPFRDMSPAADQAWFGEGLAEEVHGALTRIPDLRLVAWQSSHALATASIEEIADRLAVTHVLGGTIRSDGRQARIRAELTEVANHEVLWSRTFQPDLTNVFQAQEGIARSVVDALQVELGSIGQSPIMKSATSNQAAREHHWRGLQQWNRRSESAILAAIDHFRRAVDADPTYAAAWAGLAYAYLVLPEYSPAADVERVRDQSEMAAARALEIDSGQADALTAMGWGRMIHHYDWRGAEELIARALALDSTNVRALHWQSHVVSWQGRHGEAVALARKAAALDPLSSIMRQNLAFILMEARDYEHALLELARILTSDPDFAISRRSTWNVHTRVGDHAEASRALESWLVRSGREATAAARLAAEFEAARTRFFESGEPGTLTRELVDRLQMGVEISGQLYAAVGDRDTTLELLEQAYRERAGSRNLLSIKVNPLYDFLRDDPRFQDLVRRIGL